MIVIGSIYTVKPESDRPWREPILTVKAVYKLQIIFNEMKGCWSVSLLSDHYNLLDKG